MVIQVARGMCLAAVLAAALGGCGAIDAYRSVRGLDEADPDPATAPFSKNLAAGEAADYPNLSTVPPPPTTASTVAERATLTQKLIAERTTAEADVGPLSSAAASGANTAAAAKAAKRATPAAPAAPADSAAPLPPANATKLASIAATASAPAAAAPPLPSAPAPIANTAPEAAAQPNAGERPRGRQSREAPPQESSLQMPVIPSVPEPEPTRPAPPLPNLGPAPVIGPNNLPAVTAAVEMPAPPPPTPALEAPPLPMTAAMPGPKRIPQPANVAAFDLADPPRLDADQRARLDQVAEAYRTKPGTVKIVAYAAPAPAGQEQLASFRAALNRAQFVAAALAEAGIPSNKIQTEASPGDAAGHVEVRLAP